MSFLKYKFIDRACQNRVLRLLWHKLPYKARFYIFQRFSLIDRDYEKLTKALIDILENEPHLTAGIEKKDEVLKFLKKNKFAQLSPEFPKIWLQKDPGAKPVFNFNGALFPYLSGDAAASFVYIFSDTFLFSVLLNDNYSAALVERIEGLMLEGPYGYTTENFDVTVKAGDVVIDAGAWIGDFSAYSSSRGARAYAFEPTLGIFKKLQETVELNNKSGGGGDLPCKQGTWRG
jgi:hypothetical protein